jgi:hypothetical protein
MNSSIDRNVESLPLITALPLSLLAQVELAMLKRDYAQFLKAPPEEDRWFVMRGEEALPPQRFRDVLHRLAKGEGPLAVLRESEADLNPTPWHTLDYQASSSNRATALTVTIGFWVAVVFAGWVAVAVLGPREQLAIWQTGYFVAALALIGRLSFRAAAMVKLRRKRF